MGSALNTVELGFMGGPMTPEEDTDPYTTKVGGPALFLNDKCQIPKCKGCGGLLKLLLQGYVPLRDPPEDTRQIFVFFCPNKACKQTFHAFRLRVPADPSAQAQQQQQHAAQPIPAKKDEKAPAAAAADKLWDDDWGDDDDDDCDFGGSSSSSSSSGLNFSLGNTSFDDLEAKLAARDESLLRSAEAAANTQATGANSADAAGDYAPVVVKGDPASAYFKAFYITSDYEPEAGSTTTKLDKEAQELLRQYERNKRLCEDEDDDKDGGGNGEQYTKFEGDRAFKSFQKRVSRAETQLIRWCHGGEALQVSDQFPLPGRAPPPCPICGAPRVFEMQLVPGLMNYLEGGDSDQYDFGTIVVYACSKDCSTSSMPLAEEHVFWHKSL